MADIEIYGARQSTYVRIAWMTCEEKNAPYVIRPAAPHSAVVLAIHPFGRIPVMRHGDVELFESKAIATYIDRTFEGPMLIPADAYGAARVEQWVSVVNTTIEPTWVRYFRAHVFPKGPNGTPDGAVIEEQLGPMSDQIGVLDKAVGQTGFLAGSAFTLADITLFPILHYLHQFPESLELVKRAERLEAYYQHHAKRPSVIATSPPPLGT